jgi:hypothetical protein
MENNGAVIRETAQRNHIQLSIIGSTPHLQGLMNGKADRPLFVS